MTEIVTTREYEFSRHAADQLRGIQWAQKLIVDFDLIATRGVTINDKPKLFEIRFAHYLATRGFAPTYEYKAGVGDSSIDFLIDGTPAWLLELVSLRPSDAVKNATTTTESISQMELTGFKALQAKYDAKVRGLPPAAADRLVAEAGKGSVEGEILRAQRQLGEHVFTNGSHHKFPVVTLDHIHCLVVDGRGFAGGGDNHSEFNFVCTGRTGEFLGSEEIIYHWLDKPILGIFDPANAHSSAPIMRERIHAIHFISEEEKHYDEGGIEAASVFFCVNGMLGKGAKLGSSYPGPLRNR